MKNDVSLFDQAIYLAHDELKNVLTHQIAEYVEFSNRQGQHKRIECDGALDLPRTT